MIGSRMQLAAGGARAEASPSGAQVLSWQPEGSARDRLYLSPGARFEVGRSIRGGIPVLFPQFGLFGPLPKHGLVRTETWHALPSAGPHQARFGLQDSVTTRAHWPFAFELETTITLTQRALSVSLAVLNRDAHPFTFTAGLHSYLRLEDRAQARLSGLAGLPYLDALHGLRRCSASGQEPPASGAVDRVYLMATRPVYLVEGERRLRLEQTGFEDIVVWNPGSEMTLPDLPPADHALMLCVEAARIGNPVTLAPGARWAGTQVLQALDQTG